MRSRGSSRTIGPLLCLILLTLAAAGCVSTRIPVPPATSAVARPPSTPTDQNSLSTALEPLIAGFDGDASLWIAFADQPTPEFARNETQQVLAASLYKLAVMLEVERRVEAGQWSYATAVEIRPEDVTVDGSNEYPGTVLTVDDALEEMITYSDNGSALALLRMLGPERVNATLRAVGLGDFHVAESTDDDHIVTARAVGTFFALLAKGALVSPAASQRMVERLGRQHINDRIPAELPEGTLVAHKTGDLVGYTHDAGLIGSGGGQLIFVALTEGASEAGARAFIGDAAAIAYESAAVAGDAVVGEWPRALDVDAQVQVLRSTGTSGVAAWTVGIGLLVSGYAAVVLRRRRAVRTRGQGSRHARRRRSMAVPDRRRRHH